ncbi:MAG TPA: hypothetical protein VHL80_00350 [Polyangia bacterium]|nr:hypothetical protein [Polyangia bacterium]
MRGARLLIAVVAAASGCASLELHPPGAGLAPARLVGLQTTGIEWRYDFDGNRTVDKPGTVLAKSNVDDGINAQLSAHGGRFFEDTTLLDLPSYDAFRKWGESALLEIMHEVLTRGTTHESVREWMFSPGLAGWRRPLQADFVVISLFLDGHNSAGRALAVAFAGGKLAAQRAIACVVRLQNGQIVWCQFQTNQWNILQRAGGHALAAALLGPMFRMVERSPPAPPEPPAPETSVTPPAPPGPPAAASAPVAPSGPVDQATDDDRPR